MNRSAISSGRDKWKREDLENLGRSVGAIAAIQWQLPGDWVLYDHDDNGDMA